MKLLRKFFAPKNSLVLLKDRIPDLDGFEKELLEVKRFYTFTDLSSVVTNLKERKPLGQAVLCFTHARKHLTLEVLPRVEALEIPYVIFVDPDCVGTNRLPLVEELSIFEKHYPDYQHLISELRKRSWLEPDAVRDALQELRDTAGPLPIDALDPLSFFATWGQLLDRKPEFVEWGLTLTASPGESPMKDLQKNLDLLNFQIKKNAKITYCPGDFEEKTLAALGMEGVVGNENGAVLPQTSPLNLPHWAP